MKTFLKEHGYLVIAIIVASVFAVVVKTANVKSIKDNEKVWISDMNTNCVNTISAFNDGFEQKSAVNVSKGDIIIIDEKEYRVLEVNENEVKLLAMYDTVSVGFYSNDSDVYILTPRGEGIKYENSNIDNYLENEFYPSLSFKDAIIPQNITQNIYVFNDTVIDASAWGKAHFTPSTTKGGLYTVGKVASVSIGSRHVYALDVQDIIDYLDPEKISFRHTPTWTPQQFNTMFWNVDSSLESEYIWSRSACYGYYDCVYLDGVYGVLSTIQYNYNTPVRPAFVIDITKVEYKLK